MHDWDSAQTPVLVDARGKRAGRASWSSTAARNGYFFVVDRVTGEHIVTEQVRFDDELGEGASMSKGRPRRDP